MMKNVLFAKKYIKSIIEKLRFERLSAWFWIIQMYLLMTNNYDRCCVYDNIIIFGGYFLKVYDKLRKEQPNFHEKLVPIFGDITLPELGIKPEDLKFLCDNVNVVFHSAATIRFDEHLRYIIYSIYTSLLAMRTIAASLLSLKTAFILRGEDKC